MFDNILGIRGGTLCLSRAALAEGTNSATMAIAAPNGAGIDYVIDGILYHKADADNIAMTALAAQAALTTCLYCVQVDSGGTVSMKKGDEELNADLAAGNVVLHWPLPDDGKCAIGYLKVKCQNAATFTCGTTDLGATDVIDTFYSVFAPPVTPLTA
jgi:hypothetical protein